MKSVRPFGQGLLHDLLHLPPFVGLVEDGDDTRADKILRHQGFVRTLNSQVRLKGFELTDTVRKLYGIV